MGLIHCVRRMEDSRFTEQILATHSQELNLLNSFFMSSAAFFPVTSREPLEPSWRGDAPMASFRAVARGLAVRNDGVA